ncbi:MAG: hypothetical protein AB1635_10575 [Acidobacteriota bacterium]
MTRRTSVLKNFALALGLLACAGPAEAQQVSADLQASQVAVTNGIADATFTITIANGSDAALQNVWVVFDDGTEVQVGDVAAGGSAASAEQQRAFDVSSSPSRNVPVPVTLKFTADGDTAEIRSTVVLHLP